MPVNDNESGGNFVLESDHMSMFNIFLMFFLIQNFGFSALFFNILIFKILGAKYKNLEI